MGHNHSHGRGKRLVLTILLNMTITVSQYIGGLLTGSLALMSDATHNFSDVIALIISWIADKLAKTNYSQSRTYGLKREYAYEKLYELLRNNSDSHKLKELFQRTHNNQGSNSDVAGWFKYHR